MLTCRYTIIMKTYPIELRERVLNAVDQNKITRKEIAEMFNVSTFWIHKLIRQRRKTGSIAPLPRTQGRKPAFHGESLKKLDELVKDNCDITLNEVKEHFEGQVECSLQAISTTLRSLGWVYKKNRCMRKNRTEMM